ncbi:MAG: gene transfer agent family protein [Rhodobacteraceae bacterium]|nr:gene transfer agent family protein [Paracoccaceae bacterium]
MTNPYRGEVSLLVNGVALPMRLTLGALAELEAGLESDSLQALIERFETGAFRAVDLIALLAAGLRGAGWPGDAAELAQADIGEGPIGAAKAAGRLLRLAFSLPE